MDRRDFLLATGSAVVAAASPGNPLSQTPAQPIPAARARPLTLTVPGVDGVSWTVGQARELAHAIERASGNRYAVAVGDPVCVKAGGLKFMRAAQLVEIDRAFAFATGLPGSDALDAVGIDTWLTQAGGQSALDELAATHGLKVLLAAHTGETFLWSAEPMRTAADFAGKCVRAEGLACHVAAGLGAEPWRIVSGAATRPLASDEVAAVEASVPDAIDQCLLQPARHASAQALAPRGHACALVIRLDLWSALGPADQTVFTSAARENYRQSVTMNRSCEPMNRQALQRSYEVDVSPAPASLVAAIRTVARAVVAQAAASSPESAELNASYMSFWKSHQELTLAHATA